MSQGFKNGTITMTGEIVNTRRTRQNVESKFTGTAGKHFGLMLATSLLSIIPFIGLPNAICIRQRWYCRHTQIVGMRLKFEGKAGKLLGRFFVWGFFSVITVGIYALFLLPIRYRQWIVSNTTFEPVV